MYTKHPSFKQSKDQNSKLWRYMDFTKFVSLLETKTLYFSRSDKFEDPFEGSNTKLNVEARNSINLVPSSKNDASGEIYKEMREYVVINCWHENQYESAAMWKLYLQSNEGIAIMTNWKSLKSSIIDKHDVMIGKVKYINYDTAGIDQANLFNLYLHKRHSFEHEKEVRAVTLNYSLIEYSDGIEVTEYCFPIDVCLETLIINVYVAPSAPEWFFELTKSIIKKYGYEFWDGSKKRYTFLHIMMQNGSSERDQDPKNFLRQRYSIAAGTSNSFPNALRSVRLLLSSTLISLNSLLNILLSPDINVKL